MSMMSMIDASLRATGDIARYEQLVGQIARLDADIADEGWSGPVRAAFRLQRDRLQRQVDGLLELHAGCASGFSRDEAVTR